MPYNIVFISIDTMRPDHLGCYGYDRDTSPHMDTLASEGSLFTQAIAPNIPTAPSHTTFFTGLDAFGHKIAAHLPKSKLERSVLMLPQILQQHGYVTAAVDNLVTLGKGQGSWFARGYDYYAGFTYQPTRPVNGKPQMESITKRSVELLELFAGEPFFFFVHYWEPHTPYRPPPPYHRAFYGGNEQDPAHGSMERVYALSDEYYSAVMDDMGMAGVTDLDYVIAEYDAEIRAADAQVGRLMATLQRLGIAERTLVVLVSDHGEAFGEGNIYFDHHGLRDAVTRIALMMRLPGQIGAGRHIDAMVSGADLVPTLLEFADLEPPYGLPYELTGRSLRTLLDGRSREVHQTLVMSEATRQASYALRTSDWKLIVPVTVGANGETVADFYGSTRDPHPELYHLRSDPTEQMNVREMYPDVARDLESRLRLSIGRALEDWGGPDPVLTQAGLNGFESAMTRIQDRASRRLASTSEATVADAEEQRKAS